MICFTTLFLEGVHEGAKLIDNGHFTALLSIMLGLGHS